VSARPIRRVALRRAGPLAFAGVAAQRAAQTYRSRSHDRPPDKPPATTDRWRKGVGSVRALRANVRMPGSALSWRRRRSSGHGLVDGRSGRSLSSPGRPACDAGGSSGLASLALRGLAEPSLVRDARSLVPAPRTGGWRKVAEKSLIAGGAWEILFEKRAHPGRPQSRAWSGTCAYEAGVRTR